MDYSQNVGMVYQDQIESWFVDWFVWGQNRNITNRPNWLLPGSDV
jgi:hypothetical protein